MTAETAVWILCLLFCGIDLTVMVTMCPDLHQRCRGVRVQYHGQCHVTAVSVPLIRSVWKVGACTCRRMKEELTSFMPVVAKLLDLTDHQWSAGHWLAIAALNYWFINIKLIPKFELSQN